MIAFVVISVGVLLVFVVVALEMLGADVSALRLIGEQQKSSLKISAAGRRLLWKRSFKKRALRCGKVGRREKIGETGAECSAGCGGDREALRESGRKRLRCEAGSCEEAFTNGRR